MEIPLNAQVECTDGICGRSEFVLINPAIDRVAHVIVKEDSTPNAEFIVPVDFVVETIADTIRLRCSKASLEKMDPFTKTTFIEEEIHEKIFGYGGLYQMGLYYYLPYVTPDETISESVETQQIPPGELAVHRGTRVKATDGPVGHVDEFVVNPENGRITHLVMREGHLWGKKDVLIPVSAIGDKPHADTVFLNLDKQQVESLPTFPVHRRWA